MAVNKVFHYVACLAVCMALADAGCMGPAHARRFEGRHCDLYCPAPGSAPCDLTGEADSSIESISRHMNLTVPPKMLTIREFRSSWNMRSHLSKHCPRYKNSPAACFETPDGFTVALVRHKKEEKVLRNLRHELTHYILASHFYNLPPWVDEGLAQYFEAGEPFGQPNDKLLAIIMKGSPKKTGDILEKLVVIPAGRKLTRKEYAYSWGLACFLIGDARFGLEKISRYLHGVHAGAASRKYFYESFGITPHDIGQSWPAFFRELHQENL